MANVAKNNLHTLSRQWASRPNDQRFISLDELETNVARRTEYAVTSRRPLVEVIPAILPSKAKDTPSSLVLETPEHGNVGFTHWSFGQVCGEVGAPARYLREHPAELAAAELMYDMNRRKGETKVALYVDTDPDNAMPMLRAMTSPTYGRIYDLDVVKAVQKLNAAQNGRWVIPAATYKDSNPKRATTLYASDRDVFIFLCDDKNPIEIAGQSKPSFRGFIVSNSEVGAGCFSLSTFLYETICDNRIIWGATDIKELRMRHTSGAPERFLREAQPALLEYAKRSAKVETDIIKRAQKIRLSNAKAANSTDPSDILAWVREKTGLAKGIVEDGIKFAKAEEGDCDTLWDITQGITASARDMAHTDARIEVERAAGKLLNLAAA